MTHTRHFRSPCWAKCRLSEETFVILERRESPFSFFRFFLFHFTVVEAVVWCARQRRTTTPPPVVKPLGHLLSTC
jgi:hypothetical protein